MPHRKSISREQQLTTNLRRSPRFICKNPSAPEDPVTPVSKSSRTRRITSPHIPSSSSTPNILIAKKYSEEGSGNVNEFTTRSRKRPIIGLRRSARLNGRIEEFSYVELSPEVEEKRVPRSSSRENANSKVEEEKRVTRSSSRENANSKVKEDESVTRSSFRKNANSKVKEETSTRCLSTGNIDEGRKEVGVKRKRNHAKKDHVGIVQGWTKDQESALERAYFAAKPTPQFWKKVARLVPGKSAQDCFDKVHSNHMTPPQPQPRSRIKAHNSSPLSISASKLLNSSRPKVKRSRKSHLVQKTVRYMLQKQCQVDQDSEADLFSVLEHRTSPSAQAMQHDLVVSTPVHSQKKFELLKRCQERSSANRKSLSRFSGSSGTTLVSPPVLKQVKNKALHERYIDLLHCREANRKAAFARAAKFHQGNGVQKESLVQKKDAIKDAKNALVFDATDAIKQFQHLQANAMMSSLSDDDDDTINSEDEGDDVL